MTTTTQKRPVKLRAKVQAAPVPTPPDEARDLMLDVFGWAVDAYEAALARSREAFARYNASDSTFIASGPHRTEESDTWERWTNQCMGVLKAAERTLIETVLIACGRIEDSRELEGLGVGWKPCAFEYRSTLYVVFRDPDFDADPRLTIIAPTDLNADWMSS